MQPTGSYTVRAQPGVAELLGRRDALRTWARPCRPQAAAVQRLWSDSLQWAALQTKLPGGHGAQPSQPDMPAQRGVGQPTYPLGGKDG